MLATPVRENGSQPMVGNYENEVHYTRGGTLMRYTIRFKSKAFSDIAQLKEFIVKKCAAPLTARRQFEMLEKHLDWIEQYAELPGVDVELSIKYGQIMRNVTFGKKMAILYSVEGDIVYIHRILPQSMIIL